MADGTGMAARFQAPVGLAGDGEGNVYVVDTPSRVIRKGLPASSLPPSVLGPPVLGVVQFGFGITGLPDLAVSIESSADLSNWQVVGTYVLEGGTNYVGDPMPAQGARNWIVRKLTASPIPPNLQTVHGGNALSLSWPASASGFTLEASDTVGPNANWFPSPIAPGTVGNQCVLNLSTTNASQFFR